MQTQHGDLLAETPQRLPVLLSAFAAGILLAISLDLDQQGLASTLSRASGALAAVYLAVILLSLLSRSISNRLTGVLHRLSSWLGISLTGTWVLFSGIGCTATGSLAAGGGPRVLNQLSLPLWILGVVLVVLGLRSIEPTSRETSASSTQILALILIISLGWYLRTVDLETMPYVLSGDEGSAGLVGWEFVEGTRDNLLGLGWFSFPALYFWLLSLGQSIFGRSVYAIRLFSAIAGTLTIAATYWGGKLLFNRNVGLMAGAWLATLHMHVFFSRVAYNNVFDGFFLILAIALLYRGWTGNRRIDFILFGLTLGFSQYFYTTSRAIPLILFLGVPWLHFRHASLKSRLPHLLVALIVTVSITLPLIITYITHPATLTFTAGRVSLLDPTLLGPAAEALGMTPLGLILEQTLVTGLGLTISELQGIYADTAQPMLFGLTAVIFYISLLVSLLRWRRPQFAILILTLLVSLLIGGLSIQAPSSQRLILLTPILALLSAAVLYGFHEWLKNRWPRLRLFSSVLLVGVMGWMMLENIQQLFLEYFPNETYGSLNGEVTQEMIEFLQHEPPGVEITFIGGERMQFDSIPSIAYRLPGYTARSIETAEDLDLMRAIDQRTLFIVLPEQRTSLTVLNSIYPEASTIARYNRHGRLLFYVRVIEPPT